MNEIKIKNIRKEDIETVAKIKIDGWKNSYKGIVDGSFLDFLDTKKETEKLINNYNENGFIVATDNNEIVGFCRYSEVLDESDSIDCEIRALYVKTQLKRKGIGRELVKYAIKEFKRLGKNKMIIWCLEENYPSRAFYEKMGGKFFDKKTTKFGDKDYWLVAYVYDI